MVTVDCFGTGPLGFLAGLMGRFQSDWRRHPGGFHEDRTSGVDPADIFAVVPSWGALTVTEGTNAIGVLEDMDGVIEGEVEAKDPCLVAP